MKKRQLILAIFIIIIMISSAIGFVYTNDSNDTNTVNYNGFKFKLTENYNYIVDINGKQFIFDNLPNQLEDMELPEFSTLNTKYYLIINYSEKNGNIDYSINKLRYTLNLVNKKGILACANTEECNADLPVKDCTEDSFYLKKSSINKVYLMDKCVIIEGNDLELVRLTDKINMKLAGII